MKAKPGGGATTTTFDPAGWQAAGPQRWTRSKGGELELTIVTPPPAIDLQEEARFRNRMREEILRRGGGLVSADLTRSGASWVGRVVAKFPQQPHGMTYVGWLLYESGGAGHRVTIRFPEAGMTGMRDTVVFDAWMKERGEDEDPMAGWMRDPYDESRRDHLMKNGADDTPYDAKFPDHPLSLARVELAAIAGSLHL